MDKQDNMCFEKEALVNVWTEYIGELYADDRVTRPEINDESGPSITSAEVKHAIKKLKNNKATGTDLIAAEMLDENIMCTVLCWQADWGNPILRSTLPLISASLLGTRHKIHNFCYGMNVQHKNPYFCLKSLVYIS